MLEPIENILTPDWLDQDCFFAFGLSTSLMELLQAKKTELKIAAIIDNNKTLFNERFEDIPIYSPDTIMDMDINHKILIFASDYVTIHHQLSEYGLSEYQDFVKYEEYNAYKSWIIKRKICLTQTHIALTTRCTLKCRDCNMFMGMYEHHEEIALDSIKSDINAFFRIVDQIEMIHLLGGEPLLYKQIDEVISYIGKFYGDRIGSIGIITNGTLIPSPKLLKLCLRYDVIFNISNYTQSVDYSDKLNKLVLKLTQSGIKFNIIEKNNWSRFESFGKPLPLHSAQSLKDHFWNCSPIFNGLNDGNFYNCHLLWSAARLGIIKPHKEDFIKLSDLDPESEHDKTKLLLFSLNRSARGYLSLCRICRGCDDNFKMPVPTAEQMKD